MLPSISSLRVSRTRTVGRTFYLRFLLYSMLLFWIDSRRNRSMSASNRVLRFHRIRARFYRIKFPLNSFPSPSHSRLSSRRYSSTTRARSGILPGASPPDSLRQTGSLGRTRITRSSECRRRIALSFLAPFNSRSYQSFYWRYRCSAESCRWLVISTRGQQHSHSLWCESRNLQSLHCFGLPKKSSRSAYSIESSDSFGRGV